MKKTFLTLIAVLLCMAGFAQSNGAVSPNYPSEIKDIATLKSQGRVLVMHQQYQVPAATFFQTFQKQLGLSQADDMVLREKSEEQAGIISYRYQQHYMGVPIHGATFILHEQNGVVTYANGLIVCHFQKPFVPIFAADDAVQLAILTTGATEYAWENEGLENDLKETMQDDKATYYPTPKLMFYSHNGSGDARDYRLAYEVSVFSLTPLQSITYYIDATTGEILDVLQKNRTVDVQVQAKTRYNGERTITVDSVAPNQFVLRENSRGEGNGIYTRSLNHQGSLMEFPTQNAIDVVESDNYFDTDSVANSGHYGAEKTYDYYYETFGRNSINNNGLRLVSYVHLGTDVENACWTDGAMFYGDGTGGKQFTFMSVCGHEITHGLTEYTANLVYMDESGALNEAFSDMFGAIIADYAIDTLKWTIGDELGSAFRDMSNPKANQNPDTYHGQYWVSDNSDNGGVHTNSGIANYWFYLLCEGGEGTNDNGFHYNVIPVGKEKAARIAFYTLTENLTEYSNYADTRELSLLVAEQLYGECSPEVYTVAEAWNAVGLGHRYSDSILYVSEVLSPVTACAMSDAEPIALELTYNSCDQPLAAGTAIQVRIMVDQTTEILDTVVLTETVEPGENFTLVFNRTIDASSLGQHRLNIFIKSDNTIGYTDSLMNYTFENRIYQNSDVHIVSLVSPVSSCFLTETTPIVCAVTFDICDSIMAGDSVLIGYKLNNGDTISEWVVLDHTVTSADTLTYTFQTLADFTATPRTTVRLYSLNPGDIDASDDVVSKIVVKPLPINAMPDMRLTFDASSTNQFYYTEIGDWASLTIGNLSGYNDGKLVKVTGGNAMEYYDQLEFPENDDWWGVNPNLNARITFCADATDLAQFAIQFDLKQQSGVDIYQSLLGGYIDTDVDLHMSSLMRVLVDDEPASPNYYPATGSNDPFTTRAINLCDKVGSLHSITFESKCMAGDLMTFTLDHVYIDNITVLESDKINDYTEGEAHFLAFPNPTTGQLNIQVDEDFLQQKTARYMIYDLSGQLVTSGQINEASTLLNLNSLSTGMYLLKIVSGQQLVGTSKIAKY